MVGAFDSTNNTATVSIGASSSARLLPPLPGGPHLGGWWAGLAVLGILLLALSKLLSASAPGPWRNLRHAALGVALAALLLAALSCGGGSSSGGGGGTQSAPPPESGTVTVTGTSTTGTTTITKSASISVSVS